MPAAGQEITEGGMRFSKRDVNVLSFRSGSVAGLNAGGSAAVSGGSINTGSAASDVLSQLNPLTTSESAPEYSLAGNSTQWVPLQRLQQQATSISSSMRVREISRGGTLDENLKTILENMPNLVETVKKDNPTDPAQPFTNVQFTDTYDQLEAALDSKKTKGVHILSTSRTEQRDIGNSKPAETLSVPAWENDQVVNSTPKFKGFLNEVAVAPGSPEENVVRIASVGSAGNSNNNANFSVVGFSTNPDPNQGKNTSIAAFATNNRTVGSIRVPAQANGQKVTLGDIANQYGTTVEQLMQVNNLPSQDMDISGLNLTVPADLLTVDYFVVEPPQPNQPVQTPRSLAQRFGISVAWLMDLNGWQDPEKNLAAGERVQVPGLTKSCASQPNLLNCRNIALPPAKPLPAALETADYGAYAKTEVTYNCEGTLAAFCSKLLKPLSTR